MPGIMGFVTRDITAHYEEQLQAMLNSMVYEKFYSYGSYIDNELHVYIGWTCHRGAFDDCMPVLSRNHNIIMIFSGEVFQNSDLINILRIKGYQVSAESARFLVDLYEEMGLDFLRLLNGSFAGFLIDKRIDKAWLFNDRFGIHRIFISKKTGGFFFASEAKALLRALPETRAFDRQSVAEFLGCGTTLGTHSLFRKIDVLPGGSYVEFSKGSLGRHKKYFSIKERIERPQPPEHEFVTNLTDVFNNIAVEYLSPRDSVALSLTGGYDSRILAACANSHRGTFRSYSFGSMFRETYDVKIAKQVAEVCGQAHEVIQVDKDFLDNFVSYIRRSVFISDGYLGLSGAPELYVNQKARKIAKIRVTGNWGGELLRGDRAFKFTLPDIRLFRDDFIPLISRSSKKFEEVNAIINPDFTLLCQAPFQGYGRAAVERSQLLIRNPFLDNRIVQLLFRMPDGYDGYRLSEYLIRQFAPRLLGIATDRGYLGKGPKFFRQLRRICRELSFKAEYFFGYGSPHWFVRCCNCKYFRSITELFLGRHKFYHLLPWSTQHLPEFIREMLVDDLPLSLLFIVNERALERIVNEHLAGRKNYLNEIDALLTLAVADKELFKDESICPKERTEP